MKKPAPLIRPDDSLLLVVDVQERLLPAIHDVQPCVEAIRRMIEAASVMGLPILATEQYPAGLGSTCEAIRDALGNVPVIEKTRFSACVKELVEHLRTLDRRHVVVVGIEAHVCVQQTVLDLLRLGYSPYVCADAVGSRRIMDRDTALARMRAAKAIVTSTESVTFELLGEAGTSVFRQVLDIIK